MRFLLRGLTVAGLVGLPQPAFGQSGAVDDAYLSAYMFEQEVPRFALVIYTSRYADPSIPTGPVANAENDGQQIAHLLHSTGFDVQIIANATKLEIIGAVRSLSERQLAHEQNKGTRPIVAIFYAGHGFSSGGEDYLTGTDFVKSDSTNTAVGFTWLADGLSPSADLLMFSDACRTQLSPSPQLVGEPIDATGEPEPSEEIRIQPPSPSPGQDDPAVESRSLLSFAAHKRRMALGFATNGDRNSPYSAALVKHLAERDLTLRRALRHVRTEVIYGTRRRQYPQVEDSGLGDDAFSLLRSQASLQQEKDAWAAALATRDNMRIRFFLSDYGSSRYAAAARKWLRDHDERQQ